MTDKKITDLTNIVAADLVDADEFVVVDISADETMAITLGELKTAVGDGAGDLLAANNLSDLANAGTARTNLGLGTAATTASTDYATAAQGALADSAQQPPSEGAFVNGDKTKLDGIEASADVTDTANVTSAGALMDSELTSIASVKALNQGVATTDSPTFATVTTTAVTGDGSALTSLTSGNLTGALPAIDGSALTGIAAGGGATGGGSDQVFYENGQNVTTNYTITNAKNAMSAGPITVDSGVTVTVGAGETWTVV